MDSQIDFVRIRRWVVRDSSQRGKGATQSRTERQFSPFEGSQLTRGKKGEEQQVFIERKRE